MDLNRVTLLGRLTRDPEVRTTPNGQQVASVSIATGRMWTDQSGARQEKSEFHNCVLWGKLAEIAGQFLTKGKRIYLEGRLETRDWTGQDGVKRYRTEIIASNMIMLDGPRNSGSAGQQSGGYNQPSQAINDETPIINQDEDIKVEDIPF